MRGRVVAFDKRSGEGTIAAESGVTYPFAAEDWRVPLLPRSGQEVDFELFQDRAKAIYIVGDNSQLVADKSRIATALLALFLGCFGIHKFYLGRTTAGVIMLLCGTFGWLLLLPGFIITLIALIECIIYLVTPDDAFQRKYVEGKAAWF